VTAAFPLADFIAGRLPARGFDHRAHVEAARALLKTHDFAEAASLYVRAIMAMANAAGSPGKFHMTITVAMLSAVAERLPFETGDFDAFARANPDLFDRGFLSAHYSKERLQCDLARRTFLLPDKA